MALSPAEARTLPPAVRSAAPNLVLPTTLSVADAVARYSTLPALREKVFREAHRTPVANKGLLEEIIQLRRQHAEVRAVWALPHLPPSASACSLSAAPEFILAWLVGPGSCPLKSHFPPPPPLA